MHVIGAAQNGACLHSLPVFFFYRHFTSGAFIWKLLLFLMHAIIKLACKTYIYLMVKKPDKNKVMEVGNYIGFDVKFTKS